jgi:UrcA family protein
MRKIAPVALLLLASCAGATIDGWPEPTMRVDYGDLDLDGAGGRAELRRRVWQAVDALCRDHRDEVTPQVTRLLNAFCRTGARDTLVRAMSRPVRRAYNLALKEAGSPEF